MVNRLCSLIRLTRMPSGLYVTSKSFLMPVCLMSRLTVAVSDDCAAVRIRRASSLTPTAAQGAGAHPPACPQSLCGRCQNICVNRGTGRRMPVWRGENREAWIHIMHMAASFLRKHSLYMSIGGVITSYDMQKTTMRGCGLFGVCRWLCDAVRPFCFEIATAGTIVLAGLSENR